MSKIKLHLAESYYSVVEWLGYELWILRPWIGSQSCHIEISSFQNLPLKFFLKNGTVVEETYTFMEIC